MAALKGGDAPSQKPKRRPAKLVDDDDDESDTDEDVDSESETDTDTDTDGE